MTFEEWHDEWVELIQADINTMQEIYNGAYDEGFKNADEIEESNR